MRKHIMVNWNLLWQRLFFSFHGALPKKAKLSLSIWQKLHFGVSGH